MVLVIEEAIYHFTAPVDVIAHVDVIAALLSAYLRLLERRTLEDNCCLSQSVDGAPPQVALKFFRHRKEFAAEIEAREQAAAAKASFLSVIASFNADNNEEFDAELIARKLDSHRYMLVMPAGDRSLEATIVAEIDLSKLQSWPSLLRQLGR